MKVIFLDVDGVLNFSGTEAKAPSGCVGVVDACVKKLKRIVDETNAFIVLTSSWKKEWHMDFEKCGINGKYLVKKLERRGLHVMDKTNDEINDKQEGVDNWLKRHPNVTDWIILNNSMLVTKDNGLSDEDAQKAIEILGGK